MVFGISNEKFCPVLGIKGTFNSDAIVWYLQKLRLFQSSNGKNEKSYAIVWDNASIHKSKKVMDFLTESKMHMITIPAYSPWLNPVETMIGAFKRKLSTMKRLDR